MSRSFDWGFAGAVLLCATMGSLFATGAEQTPWGACLAVLLWCALGAGGAMLVRGTAPGSRASSAIKPDALLAVAALLSLLALLLQQQGFGQDTWAAVGVVF